MNRFAEKMDALVREAVADIMQQQEEHAVCYIASETLGEVIEKFLILHIRIWNLEDAAGAATQSGDAEAFVAINEKLDECDRVIRPRLMSALGLMLREAVLRRRMDLLCAKNVKHYEGTP